MEVTRKEILNTYDNVFAIGYCEMHYLLRYQNALAYNHGIYGWNFTLYVVNGVALCTGYRNKPGKSVDYELVRKYEKKAEQIAKSWTGDYDGNRNKTNKLLYKFIEEITKGTEQ